MRSKAIFVGIGGSLLLALAVGCSSEQKAEQQASPAVPTAQVGTATSQTETAGPEFPLTGTVAETFASGGYTYLRLKTADRDYWVATAQAAVQEGDEVTVESGQLMQNFQSRTLNRNFEEIIFTTGLGGENGPAAVPQQGDSGSFAEALQKENGQQPPAAMGDAAMTGSTKAVVPAAEIDVEKAAGDNGYRVGELHEQAAQLNGKEVQVRGKVVKVSPNIMGRNWIHLQDGTGNAQQNTHDLVVTSASAQPEKGEVVTVKGVLHADKDFGSGYKYDAIVEEAEILKP